MATLIKREELPEVIETMVNNTAECFGLRVSDIFCGIHGWIAMFESIPVSEYMEQSPVRLTEKGLEFIKAEFQHNGWVKSDHPDIDSFNERKFRWLSQTTNGKRCFLEIGF